MMTEQTRDDHSACPQCGGPFVPDERQDPAVLVDRKKRNASSPPAALRFAETVADKARTHGTIHRCVSCGYRARFHAAAAAA